MKKNYILSLVIGFVLGNSAFAQGMSQQNTWAGVTYNFNPSFYGVPSDDDMGNVVFENDFDIKHVEITEGKTCMLTIYASGTLSVNGRYREVPSTILSIDPVEYSSFEFGSYLSPDEGVQDYMLYTIEANDTTVNGNVYYKMYDNFRFYWLVWNAAKRIETANPTAYHFERGSEITDADVDANNHVISHTKYSCEFFYLVKTINGQKKYIPVTWAEISGYDEAMREELLGDAEDELVDELDEIGYFDFNFELKNCTQLFYTLGIDASIFNFDATTLARMQKPISVSFGPLFTSLPSMPNAWINSFSVDVQNPSYISICDGQVLCTKDKDGNPRTVIAVATGAGTINLPLSVDSIAPNSVTYGAQGLKLVSQNTSLKNAAGSGFATHADGEGSDVNSISIPLTGLNPNTDYITVPAAYIKSSKSSGSYGITQPTSTITIGAAQACVGTLKDNPAVCYIDLSNCTISGDKSFGVVDMSVVGPNCLLFLPEGVTGSGNNVVTMKNGVRTCKNLTLVRENGKPFFSPYDFVAENVTISGYEIGENIVGLVLPFEYSNDNVKLATYTGFSNGALNFNNTVTTIPANTPFVARKKDGVANQPLSATNVTIASTPNTVPDFPADGWLMNGTYLTVTNNGTACSIYGFSKNVLKKVEGATFKPFSAYFVCNNANGASEANVRFLISEADEATGIDSVLSLASVSAGNGVISVSASNAKIVVASINGAVLFDGVVNGTKTIEVQPGVYVVNGKKVVVNK